MKKNLYACMDRHRKVMKLILMMKATFILSVLFALQVHAGVYSQQVRLSMNLEKATIKQVIAMRILREWNVWMSFLRMNLLRIF